MTKRTMTITGLRFAHYSNNFISVFQTFPLFIKNHLLILCVSLLSISFRGSAFGFPPGVNGTGSDRSSRSTGIPARLSTPRYDAFRMVQPSSHLSHEHSRAFRGQQSANSSWMNMQAPRRSRPMPHQHSQMRFSQPPPPQTNSLSVGAVGGPLGSFGGSSGPGCGGGDFWAELAQFGIYPSTSSNLGSGSSARSFFNSPNLGK